MDSSNTHQNYHQPNSGLLRFRSAPSSFLANLDGVVEKGQFESERLVPRFMSCSEDNSDLTSHVTEGGGGVTFANSSQSYCGLPPSSPSAMMDSFEFSLMDHPKTVNSSLERQTSSPVGLFTNLSMQQHGYSNMKDLGLASQISGVDSHTVAAGFSFPSWNDSSNFLDNFSGLKREADDEGNFLSRVSQNGVCGNRTQMLSHHLSLPKTSVEINAMENFLELQDSAPLIKTRAKRGCATHPRSIAERVRRTRISQRMRKLQDLVPNMDKQTNTSDMLDLAVEYIKDLQRQFKNLSESRANCKCSNRDKRVLNRIL